MKAQLREQAIKLRLDKNLGYASIAKLVSVSKGTLSRWLRDYPLTEERIREIQTQNLKNGEVKIERYRNSMRKKRDDKFQENYLKYKVLFSGVSKESELIAGLMLYLAEGSKKDNYRIVLANTDSDVIKFHMKWAIQFFDVSHSAFKVQLHLYPNMDLKKEIEFWKKELRITDNQFYKHQIRDLKKTSFSYRESFRHGTCSVYLLGTEKKRELMSAIKAFTDSFLNK